MQVVAEWMEPFRWRKTIPAAQAKQRLSEFRLRHESGRRLGGHKTRVIWCSILALNWSAGRSLIPVYGGHNRGKFLASAISAARLAPVSKHPFGGLRQFCYILNRKRNSPSVAQTDDKEPEEWDVLHCPGKRVIVVLLPSPGPRQFLHQL
jgi:hypothetical protein